MPYSAAAVFLFAFLLFEREAALGFFLLRLARRRFALVLASFSYPALMACCALVPMPMPSTCLRASRWRRLGFAWASAAAADRNASAAWSSA